MVMLASVDLVDILKARSKTRFARVRFYFVDSKEAICSLGDSASQIALMRFIRPTILQSNSFRLGRLILFSLRSGR